MGAIRNGTPRSRAQESTSSVIAADEITRAIVTLRGHRVRLDQDLATLYGVPTKALVQAVRRNRERFPGDFMFRLEIHDVASLRSQIVTSNEGRGGRRTMPYAFTEQGVAIFR